MKNFTGVKLALLNKATIVGILRDNSAEISFPNMWDVTGGTREGSESALECAFRETNEELGLQLSSDSIVWCQEYKDRGVNEPGGFFMVANITDEQVSKINFGGEGQRYELHNLNYFLGLENVVPFVRQRLSDYLAR